MTCELIATPGFDEEIVATIRRALAEDVGPGDVTTGLIVAAEASANARIVAKQDGFVAGLAVVGCVFRQFDEGMSFTQSVSDGAAASRGQTLIELSGSASAILTGERTALNFLGRMSGIATLTRKFVDAVRGTGAAILDTRKTAPGLRSIDKLAVQSGGGRNHRRGLYDMVLIKDNHIDQAGSLTQALNLVRKQDPRIELEVEACDIAAVREALDLGVKRILLDNMLVADLRKAVEINGGRARLEASGNVTLANVREIAETGVDFISVGALTHSAPAFDVSLRWVK